MLNTSVNISRTEFGDVFVQTNTIRNNGELIGNISDCQLNMSEEDCIELAIALSYVHLQTEYENADNYVTVFSDGKIIKEYQNE